MGECWTEGRSGKDGRYRLYVEPGMYEFQVRVPGVGVARMPRQAIATTGAITLHPQFTMLRTVPSTVVACCPCTAWPNAGVVPRFWADDASGASRLQENCVNPTIRRYQR